LREFCVYFLFKYFLLHFTVASVIFSPLSFQSSCKAAIFSIKYCKLSRWITTLDFFKYGTVFCSFWWARQAQFSKSTAVRTKIIASGVTPFSSNCPDDNWGEGTEFPTLFLRPCHWLPIIVAAMNQLTISINFYRAACNADAVLWWEFCLSVRPSVRLSVRLSVTRVDCDKPEEISVQIFIPYEKTFSLVFWEEEWLVGGDPF